MVGELEAFSYSMVHDLRAPLRAMDGFAKLLEEEFGEAVGERGKDYVHRIVVSAKRLDEFYRGCVELQQDRRRPFARRTGGHGNAPA